MESDMHSAPPTAPTNPPQDASPRRDNHTPSCAVCQRRKVKCNRVYPCGPCQKTGLECMYRPVNEPGRKRLKRGYEEAAEPGEEATIATLLARSNHLWSAISAQAELGASPTAAAGGTASTRREIDPELGAGISGDSIYESSVSLGSKIAERAQKGHSTPRERHFIFSQPQPPRFLPQPAQPPANHVVQLWQTYLTNVDPILKIVHAPTLQQTVLSQVGKPDMALNLKALTSAIYFISVVSLQDDECEALLQTSRTDLVSRYRLATEEALSAAGFVTTTDLTVLEALVIYLATLLSQGETSAVWSMTGLAIRIAGTLGLARDGSSLGLQPFEAEMRRRLWWALVYLDARTSELVGQDKDLLMQHHDVHLPANLNDTQLFPDMQRLPESRPAATEMTYVLLRATLASTLNAMPEDRGPVETWQRLRAASVPMSEKAGIVENLEHKVHEELLRFCDPTVPLQALVINAAQTFSTKMRLVGNIPFDRSATTAEAFDGYSENLFQLAIQMMRLQLDLFTDPSLRRWKWHWQGNFQWYALAELVRQTRLRQSGPETMKAWFLIREVFDCIVPTLEIAPQKSPLLEAIRALLHSCSTLKSTQNTTHTSGLSCPLGVAVAPSDHSTSPPGKRQTFGLSTGQGSRPHSALLPGMDSLPTPATSSDQMAASAAGLEETMPGVDLDAIDWAEFDRLTSELCGE
ncbi:hypothetical protein B0A55_07220 [Friedmanniomyces simplex]|uniref:Zn(2)-C6 fungal-type domain-containing protein n=1 Tax=Friedmanniomyces simplex TaxID=329884 RepID=A0A4U0XAX3_9PEZI|nr:hypothetical protein B0A55_07220 [Friedmanniomyces simplex]